MHEKNSLWGLVMSKFREKYESFLTEFSKGKTMVLSTSENSKVSSRMMSVVCINGAFYFQTDRTFRKYRQLAANPKAALCIDNIQIEGLCRELGSPMDNPPFCRVFEESFSGSFRAYSALANERLFVLEPEHVQRWVYKNGVPFIEVFDIKEQKHEITEYRGI